MDDGMLTSGLSHIAKCKERTGDIWEAHYGAAAIASAMFAQENRVSAATADRIGEESRAMLRARAYVHVSRNAEQAELSLAAEPAEQTKPTDSRAAEQAILAALEPTMDELHWVGHNVIYAALSLLAMRELGSWGSEEEIAGIASLIQSFRKTIPGRSWLGYSASEAKRLQPEAGDLFPAIQTPRQLSELVLGELASFRTIYRAEAHHDLIGHMLTFSHALNILHELGHAQLFLKGLPSLLKVAKVLRKSQAIDPNNPPRLFSPVDRWPLPPAHRSEWLPIQEEYWLRDFRHADWDFGHVFKFPYSFYNHLNRLTGPHPQAAENFRYVIE